MTTKLFQTLAAATTLAGIVATAGAANAASLSYTGSTNFKTTNIINESIGVQKFDASLGTLTGVTVKFTSDIQGSIAFENLGNAPTDITVTLGSNVNLKLGNDPLFNINPQTSQTFQSVASFDGVLDFQAPSGNTLQGLSATQSDQKTISDSQMLQSFIGTGNLNFLFSALATSNVSGSGNVASLINTLARGTVAVTYNYDAAKAVPEPSAAIGIGLVAGIGLLSQRKKSWLKASN
ncbi:PEP-CTERM sorting domain-containing protein [Fortiea sp. LEGE XX443]|uniref:choice-of-anchor E domain-containing protein n=1 Tax=Fortiea sp. LEGE XX443 TaxID=1828611 RepID=UPI00187EC48E|nr:PEP-CTERM sorting domain-containing protein [Fortiea sp. LEGE XX443]MBE9006011.1 PEP-CTERM sorting domain-containing protein [Fortiea sp. LEGE XX443]